MFSCVESRDGHMMFSCMVVIVFMVLFSCVCFLQFDKNTLTDQALELLSLVPEGYIPLPHQIGGHRHVDGKLGEGEREGGSNNIVCMWSMFKYSFSTVYLWSGAK